MTKKIAAFVARHAGRERSASVRALSLFFGFALFFVFAPLALGFVGHLIAAALPIGVPRPVEIAMACFGLSAGFFFLLWAVLTFWRVGRGTPVPLASPVKLVTVGPFKYARNPIMLGAVFIYFGLGLVWEGFMTGLVMAAITVVLGTLYHKAVEEKELALRFGDEYARYRARTSFLIPRPPRPRL
jgi:protein-S-isoprenylcysteine O-methyltransferase Ste14